MIEIIMETGYDWIQVANNDGDEYYHQKQTGGWYVYMIFCDWHEY